MAHWSRDITNEKPKMQERAHGNFVRRGPFRPKRISWQAFIFSVTYRVGANIPRPHGNRIPFLDFETRSWQCFLGWSFLLGLIKNMNMNIISYSRNSMHLLIQHLCEKPWVESYSSKRIRAAALVVTTKLLNDPHSMLSAE